MLDLNKRALNWQVKEMVLVGFLCAECVEEIDGESPGDLRYCKVCSGEEIGEDKVDRNDDD